MAKRTRKAGKLDKFKNTYFTECSERLADVESVLGEIKKNGLGDDEQYHELFRSIHSIKGGAGAFGFDNISLLTHSYENVLGALRNHDFEATGEVVDLLIEAADKLAEIVDFYREGKKSKPNAGEEIIGKLDSLLGEDDTVQQIADPDLEAEFRDVFIRFFPDEKLFESANDPLFIIRELQTYGDLKIEIYADNLPSIENINPEISYLGWDFVLQTDRSEADIRQAFEFVEDVCELEISDVPLEPIEPAAAVDGPDKSDQPETIVDTGMDGKPSPAPEPKSTALVQPSALIRVELDRVDKLVNMVGELVITQAVLEQNIDASQYQDESTVRNLGVLSSHMREIQENVMEIRMQPVQSVFARMPRLVREISRSLGKKVKLVTSGEATEVDKTIIEHLTDPLTHMIRNAIDHGIESPEERASLGKPEEAIVFLSASHRSGQIAIEVTDDGRGIDTEKVFQRAVEREIIAPDADMPDEAICDLIFMPGFSTAAEITDVSGRGVGMDVVRRITQEIGGRVIVDSTKGKGSRFIMSLPLTLAVMDGMIVEVGEERFVMPLGCIIESIRPTQADISEIANKEKLARFRDDYVPLVFLSKLFDIRDGVDDPCQGLIVFVETDIGNVIGVVVDDLLEERQVVIKSLEENFMPVDGVSAATILGNGRVALILEVNGLHDMYRKHGKPALPHRPRSDKPANGEMHT